MITPFTPVRTEREYEYDIHIRKSDNFYEKKINWKFVIYS